MPPHPYPVRDSGPFAARGKGVAHAPQREHQPHRWSHGQQHSPAGDPSPAGPWVRAAGCALRADW